MPDSDVPLDPLLRGRFSPLAFDPDHDVDDRGVQQLLEAARWAPSAGNSQPWGFLVAGRTDPVRAVVEGRLAPSAARWAPSASLLVVNSVRRHVEGSELEYSEFADYDLGQAVAHLTLQAQAMGLSCRQFRAFDAEGLAADLGTRDGWRLMTITAVGRAADQQPSRDRRSRSALRDEAFAGD